MTSKLALAILALTFSACAPIVKQMRALQPAVAADSPTLWIEIVTNNERANGIYRCVDDGKQWPTCAKAILRVNP